MVDLNAPVIIGGSGGSGTRVLAELLMMSGYYMGRHQNVSCDALDFVDFYDQWVTPYNFGRSMMNARDQSEMCNQFNASLTCFKGEDRSLEHHHSWGWKNPRSMLMLPFLNTTFSDMKFIHLVRDGRDMAFSENTNQIYKHAEAILTGTHREMSAKAQAMHFWSESNMLVAEYGEAFMGGRYIRVRFEDLCSETEKTLMRLESFLGVALNDKEFSAFIHTPKSVGRWLDKSGSHQDEFMRSGEKAMRYFAYQE